jgi:protein involved in polysaccharide export with SLBB domain
MQREYEALKQKLEQAQLESNQSNRGPVPEPQDRAKVGGSVAFLQEETNKTQLRILQTEIAVRERYIAQLRQQIGNQSNPNQSQLDQLHANEEALERYKADLSRINKQIEEKQLTSSSSQAVDSNSKYRVYVTGRVQRPGDIPWEKPLTVLQALALAGGFQEYAKSDAVSIIRTNGNSSTLFRFNYSEVIRGVNSSQNFYLENGDVVVVP